MSKQITFGLTVLIITTNNLVNSVITCTMPWKKVHRGCYMFNTHLSTWYDAQQICQRNGGYLASMSSRAEAVRVLLNIRTSSMKHWWLGLSLNKTIAKWKWEDGSDLHTSVIAWKPGEPNKSLRDEQCGEMNIQGRLNDQKCDSLNPSVCEQYPPTLSPPSTDAATTQDPETTTDVPDSTTRNVEKPQCDPLEEYKRSWPSASEGEVVSCPCKTDTVVKEEIIADKNIHNLRTAPKKQKQYF
nr:C-type lectin 1-like isoform X3 [Crassostrea gigas]XP_034312249.1 C-type lectin 1-like isoform X3 [Crassostrea gigas]XP_034312250.1 C-type lectin 1-like isoform X3 [Crassostrea gigas]XP_034312251.1 C-type lectin 1-like isoform X3 [Crassostrea gigas]